TITNLTPDLGTTVLVDGQPVGKLATGERASVRVGDQHTLLATLPEVTFFTRYASTFGRPPAAADEVVRQERADRSRSSTPSSRDDDARRCPPYDGGVLRSLRISNLVLIREAELDLHPGLNAITGETGAGKTILTNAIGLLLGARGDAALIGAAGDEAYVEAEFAEAGDEALGVLAELRPEGEDGVVLARRIFADGRTRAYAWGRSAAREDVA